MKIVSVTLVSVLVVLGTQARAQARAQDVAPRIFAPGIISSAANDLSPAFTPDGRTVYFTRANAARSTILVSRLSGGKWSTPQVAPFSGEWRDLEATMAPDGSHMIFVSNRPATSGGKPLDGFYNGAPQVAKGGNLWRVERTPSGWSAPHRLPDVVNANSSIYSPSIAADGSVYFMQPTGAKTRFHLFRAQFGHGTYSTPVAVPVSAGEEVSDFDPAVAPDESFMVFSSGRLAEKSTALFIAFQKNGTWETPVYMGDAVNAPPSGDIEARLSPDHRTLYFSTTRVLPVPFPQDRAAAPSALERMTSWDNGLANIWSVSLDPWLSR